MPLYIDLIDIALPKLTTQLPEHDHVIYIEVEELEWFQIASEIALSCGPYWKEYQEELEAYEYTEAMWLEEILHQINECLLTLYGTRFSNEMNDLGAEPS